MTDQNKKTLSLVALISVLVLMIVAVLIYNSNSSLRSSTDFSSDSEFSNATAILNIPAGSEGEAPGSCQVSLVSSSSAYPVLISDISKFYDFSESIADCDNGFLTVYINGTSSPTTVSYVSITLEDNTEGVLRVDESTGITYSVNSYVGTGGVANMNISIDDVDEATSKDDILLSILLSEIGALFNESGEGSLTEDFDDLESIGLVLPNTEI